MPAGVPVGAVPDGQDSIAKALQVGQAPGVPPELALRIHDAASAAFLNGMRTAVVCGAVVIGLVALVAWRWLPAEEAAPEGNQDPGRKLAMAEAAPLAAVEDGPLV